MKQKNKLIVRTILCLLLVFLCNTIYAQLAPFSLTATGTAQTCLGNGSLNFSVNGTAPGASMEFEVYHLPNTTQPVTTVTTLAATGLVSGNYSIVATQTLNGQSNTATATAVIADNTVPFAYTTTIANANCQEGGSITVIVTSGTASAYEIIAGPETFPQQTSNVFADLQSGQYQVRVYDSCGDALVTTVTVAQQAAQITISDFTVSQGLLPSCNTVNVSYVFSVPFESEIAFPVTIQYTIHPPGGGVPVVINETMTTGFVSNYVTQEIPFYNAETYLFDIKITDACGNIYTKPNNLVFSQFSFSWSKYTPACNAFYINMSAVNYVLPLTVNFVSAPPGFDPSLFNPTHPVINDQNFAYGDPDSLMPPGTYVMQITDACGHTAQNTITLQEGGVPDVNIYQGEGCFSNIYVSIPNGREIVTAVVTAAPSSFGVVPQNMMANVNMANLTLEDAPPGNYTFEFTDICGNSYSVDVTVSHVVDTTIYNQQAMGCMSGFGTVMIYVAGKELTSVKITAAPEAYSDPLPSDISFNIVNGTLYMNALPGGTYSFEAVDECGNLRTGNVTIVPYIMEEDPAEIIFNCGSFDINLHDGNTADIFAYYLLQKFNEASGQWVHPENGSPGSGVVLENNTVIPTLTYTGNFRIIRQGFSYINGSEFIDVTGSPCINTLAEFTFTGAPFIVGAYAFPCSDGLSEVIIDAVGVPPLEYAITQKNGEPFIINNGANMVFTSLENAVYNFSVTDECGNIVNIQYDITNLQPLEIKQRGFCDGDDGSLYVKSYTFLTYEWWKEGEPDVILSTGNTLDFPSFEPGQLGTYYLKIVSTTPGSCIEAVLEHTIELQKAANAGEDVVIVIQCNHSESVNMNDYLTEGHVAGGTWRDINETSQLSGSILLVEGIQPGIYLFAYEITQCGVYDIAIMSVHIKDNDAFDVDIAEGCIDNTYSLSITNISDIEGAAIAWTGPGNFTSTEAVTAISLAGTYTATITNTGGCIAEASITVDSTSCGLPKGVSPNGDGLNDTFDLSNLEVTDLKIFNRYGLKVYEAQNYVNEWHGQSDKGTLSTGTYYYMIILSGGKQATGWVYLQREE